MARIRVLIAAVIAVLTLSAGAVVAAPLPPGATLTNGGFESGFCHWTVSNGGAGAWVDNDGSALPLSHNSSQPPRFGGHAAVFDQGGPSSGVLYQDFKVPASGFLDFSYSYANSWVGGWATDVDPFALGVVNQWLSIDVLVGGADPRSLNPADVITTVDRPTGAAAPFMLWTDVPVDLTGHVGETVRLRFAVVDTQNYLQLWVDSAAPGANCAAGADGRTPEEIAYCTVPGNTWPNGSAIRVNTFVTLLFGQVDSDPDYKGAVVANYVKGMGLTCDQIPMGYTLQGKTNVENAPETHADIYPYYAPAPTP